MYRYGLRILDRRRTIHTSTYKTVMEAACTLGRLMEHVAPGCGGYVYDMTTGEPLIDARKDTYDVPRVHLQAHES